MAGDWQGFALEKAELLSSRLKDLLSSGQAYVRAQFGMDLGLKPELYPTWVMLTTAAAGLLLLLSLSWAAVYGGLNVGKKRGSLVNQGSSELGKAHLTKTAKPEEQKKRNKKKTPEKKTQSNGQPVAVAQDEVDVVPKLSLHTKPETVPDVQAPVQVKKDKKKAKTNMKPVQYVTTIDRKEPDDGAWETKVSNREKRQQRRKDKGSETSGSPGGEEPSKTHVDSTMATAPTNMKKNRGSHASSSRRDEPSVNGGGWTDFSLKIPGQMGSMEGTKWGAVPSAPHYRTQPEPQSWTQESQAWNAIDSRMKADLNQVSFSMLGLNTTGTISKSIELQWASHPHVDDEWSGINGVAATDPSSDWNAPVEHWGNYEEPPVTMAPAPLLKQQPFPNKVLADEKDTEDPTGGAAKSKKKRKKKKKSEEEATPEAQMVYTVPDQVPVPASRKQNLSISSSQKRREDKSEQIAEPPKASQKKKLRRET
ncbi:metadherin a [Aulostomus maculatus]